VPAGGVEGSKLCLFSVIMPAKCVSSISPRFHYRRLAFCFFLLAAILESPSAFHWMSKLNTSPWHHSISIAEGGPRMLHQQAGSITLPCAVLELLKYWFLQSRHTHTEKSIFQCIQQNRQQSRDQLWAYLLF
jgi:hypothetical protein